jgi:uncharacterized membrane protein YiaA
MKTRGSKSSERKACYHAFIAGVAMACYGIYHGADLNALGVLIGSVTLPLMVYGGFRTAYKRVHGESE